MNEFCCYLDCRKVGFLDDIDELAVEVFDSSFCDFLEESNSFVEERKFYVFKDD